MKMLLIRKIDVVEVDRDPIEILTTDGARVSGLCPVNDGRDMLAATIMREYVHGTKFRRPDGVELNVGTSRQAAGVIGIQYECWDNMEKDLKEMSADLFSESLGRNKAEQKLAKYEKAGFWKRLAYAVNGMMD